MPPPPPPGCFSGIVKSFKYVRGIVTTDDGIDVPVHAKACTDGKMLKVGDRVQFDLVADSQGDPGDFECVNVTGGGRTPSTNVGGWAAKGVGGAAKGPGSPAVVQPGGAIGKYTSIVKSFAPEKGIGFLTDSDDNQYFFHERQLADRIVPVAGDSIQHDFQPSPWRPGFYEACNITGGTGPALPKGGKGKDKGDGKGGGPRLIGTKRSMCAYFPLGTCRNNENCAFAHSEAEIGTSFDFTGGAGGDGADPTGGDKGATGGAGGEAMAISSDLWRFTSVGGGKGATGGAGGYGVAATGGGKGAPGPYGAWGGGW